MMRTHLFFVLLGITILCSCREEQSFYLSGVFIDNCKNKLPIGNATLSCEVGKTRFTAKTDVHGVFVMEGTWSGRSSELDQKLCFLELTGSNAAGSDLRLAQIPPQGAVLDTIYYCRDQSIIFDIDHFNPNYSTQDTLFVLFNPACESNGSALLNSFGELYTTAYPITFKVGVLDTITMKTHGHPYYHDDGDCYFIYWVNDYQDWAKNPLNDGRVLYSPSGIVDKPSGGCNSYQNVKVFLN